MAYSDGLDNGMVAAAPMAASDAARKAMEREREFERERERGGGGGGDATALRG
jgi:hypothetical protein